MQLILYAGGTFLTGDDLADALLDYGRALGAEDKAEVVRLPIVGDDGFPAVATLLIGPASQIVAQSVRSAHPEPRDPELVTKLRALAAGVNFPAASAPDAYPHSEVDDDF